ncbi:MAG: SDR family oxidoreductase [Nitrospirae bacterium]|nr:MAG: SDR family oxidoreductase [Nitrospirota bacterium]
MLAVITGASRGIGASYALQLAARGYALHLVARDAARLARVADEIRAAHGIAVEEIVLDLAQADGAERLYADVRRRRTEPVDLLVNNAGFGLYGEFVDMPMPRIQEMLVLHLLTVTKLVRLFLPEMRERRKGAIINVASVAGLLPLPYLSLYAATKAFMVSLGAGLALEAQKYGVMIQTCCPGRTATDFQATAGIKPYWAPGDQQTADEVVSESLAALDRGRDFVVTGWRNRLLTHVQKLVPRRVVLRTAERLLRPNKFLTIGTIALAGLLWAATIAAAADHLNPLTHGGPPAVTGNPAADTTLPPRLGRPGQLLFGCSTPTARAPEAAEVYASALDFDEGRQSFFLKRLDSAGKESLYPLHGHFLDGGRSGIFMVHDGKGVKDGDAYRIDQSVNMGVLFLRTADSGLRATLDVFAEENGGRPAERAGQPLAEYSCRWAEEGHRLSSQREHVRAQPNSGAKPPSHWYRESDKTLLTCRAESPAGEYQLELRGSKIWPGHLGFLVVRVPGIDRPVGYNVHMLEGPGRLLIHAHSFPHRTKASMLDTLEETETVIGGLLLVPSEAGYTGWIGLAGASADPYNISFSRDATVGDYAAQGRIVVPPLPVTCR